MSEQDERHQQQESSLPKRWRILPPDGRSRGSMSQFVREFLSLNPDGWARGNLRTVLSARSRFARILERNPGAYGHMVWRLIRCGDIEERDGRLYASARVRRRVESLKSISGADMPER